MLVFNIDQQWVADLVEVQNISKYNKGMRYLLMVIDALAKHAWVEPIKTKMGKAVTEAFEKILKRAKGRKPINLQTDDGKEFYNSKCAALMKQKTSTISRPVMIPKPVSWNVLIVLSRTDCIDILRSRTPSAFHYLTTGMAPNQVNLNNKKQVWDCMHGKRFSKKLQKGSLKVKDSVRLNKKFRQFKIGYLPGWNEEVFVVQRVISGVVPTYKIEELNGTLLNCTFYEQDLQKVNVSKGGLFRVDKVVKRKGN